MAVGKKVILFVERSKPGCYSNFLVTLGSFDPSINGGSDNNNIHFVDTWIYDQKEKKDWTKRNMQKATIFSPKARSDHAMASLGESNVLFVWWSWS